MIKLTEISDRLQYPSVYKAIISSYHSQIIELSVSVYSGTKSSKQGIIDALNAATYSVISKESTVWNTNSPLDITSYKEIPEQTVRNTIRGLYLTIQDVIFDIDIVDTTEQNVVSTPYVLPSQQPVSKPMIQSPAIMQASRTIYSQAGLPKKSFDDWFFSYDSVHESTNDDITLDMIRATPPMVDYSKPFAVFNLDGDVIEFPTSLPIIPKVQSDISISTKVELLSDSDLLKLFPNRFLRTRNKELYEKIDGIDYDNQLGVILPIAGFTKEQLIDNIIRYPHLYLVRRKLNDDLIHFYNHIEINGKLYPIMDIWSSLPESKVIPMNKSYIKEYVIRRYILEEEAGQKHKYPMYTKIQPFLTLFMINAEYESRGYTNLVQMAKQCVISRVAYHKSINPAYRKVVDYYESMHIPLQM